MWRRLVVWSHVIMAMGDIGNESDLSQWSEEHEQQALRSGLASREGEGYVRCITYTQAGKSGTSLVAAGWLKEKELCPRKS